MHWFFKQLIDYYHAAGVVYACVENYHNPNIIGIGRTEKEARIDLFRKVNINKRNEKLYNRYMEQKYDIFRNESKKSYKKMRKFQRLALRRPGAGGIK